RGDQVADHRDQPGERVEADRLLDAGDDETAFEQVLHRLDPAQDRMGIVAGGETHRARALRLAHRWLHHVSYLGMTASGGKGWNAQALGAKPTTLLRTSEKRSGGPNGM